MTYRKALRDLAFDTHGVVTIAQAEAEGVPAVEVRKLASRDALTRIGHGVYRMNEAPADHLTEFATALASVGHDSVLANESVLAAHDLAQVNLRQINVATGERVRKRLPDTISIVPRHIPAHERDDIDGLPAMRLGAAILASQCQIMNSRLVDAARQAAARGLINHAESLAIINDLESE